MSCENYKNSNNSTKSKLTFDSRSKDRPWTYRGLEPTNYDQGIHDLRKVHRISQSIGRLIMMSMFQLC